MTPSPRMLVFVLLASLPLVLVPLLGILHVLALAPTVAVLLIALADRLAGCSSRIEIERRVKPVLSVGTANQIELQVTNSSRRSIEIQLADEPPAGGDADPFQARLSLELPGRTTRRVEYLFTPAVRGRHSFRGVQFAFPSALRFWRVRRRLLLTDEVDVYPNIEAMHRFELLARVNSLDEFGVRAVRMKGEGTEFERLREYRQGDEPRRVDWKATARLGRMIVREMGQDRNQNVFFLVDLGRMMRQTTGGLSHFDYALNTAIILGHIAQKRGDNIGAVIFSDRVKRFVPLGRGAHSVERLVRATYDLQPEAVATNYTRVLRYVMAHVHKRSLLLLLTHFTPGEDRRLIRSYLKSMGHQHLPLCLFFKEPELEEELHKVPGGAAEAFHRAAAIDLMLERRESLSSLRHAGVIALDALPGEYSAVAIGQYLDIKARNLL